MRITSLVSIKSLVPIAALTASFGPLVMVRLAGFLPHRIFIVELAYRVPSVKDCTCAPLPRGRLLSPNHHPRYPAWPGCELGRAASHALKPNALLTSKEEVASCVSQEW
jgi:hypothetical protein